MPSCPVIRSRRGVRPPPTTDPGVSVALVSLGWVATPDDPSYRGEGIYVTGGLRLRNLSISFAATSELKDSSAITEVRTEAWHHWLKACEGSVLAVRGRARGHEGLGR